MAFTLQRTSRATPDRLWAVLTDFSRHGEWVPLTTMRTDAGEPRLGWGFVGLSGVGPARMADHMVITEWEPGRRFRVAKLGPVLVGWAEAAVETAPGGSRVTWTESVLPRGLPRLLHGAADAAGRSFFDRVMTGITAAADATADAEADVEDGDPQGAV